MKPRHLEKDREIWRYVVSEHKNAWRGMKRVVMLGGRTQSHMGEMLKDIGDDDFVFSPGRVEDERLSGVRNRRKTKRWPSHERAALRKKKARPGRRPGDRWTEGAVGRVLRKHCVRKFPLPDQLARLTDESKADWKLRLGRAGLRQAEEHRRKYWFTVHSLRHWYGTEVRRAVGLKAA